MKIKQKIKSTILLPKLLMFANPKILTIGIPIRNSNTNILPLDLVYTYSRAQLRIIFKKTTTFSIAPEMLK